ncbi:MAG: YbaK/EbsC family protein [Firmicutes bacterium]|nr:YbaK/EbsC family protein [Bacillota bacterium]
MSIEKVKEYFKSQGMEERVLEFDVSSATVEQAAQALGCEPSRIAKTLAFGLGKEVILVVAAGDARIDNRKYRAQFKAKAKMIPAAETEALVGYEVGGICPFKVNCGVQVYLDQSLRRFKTVFPAGGSSNSAVKLTIPELEKHSQCRGWVDVCKIR